MRFCAECYVARKEASPQAGAEQPSASLASVPVLPQKALPDDSKPDGKRLQRVALRTDRPVNSELGIGDAAVLIADPMPQINFEGKITRLRDQIERGKKTVFEAAMKAEDLEAILQRLRRTHDRIIKKWK